MTVIGKILAVLVFVLSLVFLGFAITINRLNKDPATKRSWHDVAQQRKQEAQNAYEDVKARDDQNLKLKNDVGTLTTQLADEKKARLAETAVERERALKAEAEAKLAQDKFRDSQRAVDASTLELEQRTRENLRLSEVIKTKDLEYAKIVDQMTQANGERIQREIEAKSYRDRLAALERDYQQLVKTMETQREQATGRGAGPERLVINPPPEDVKGLIRRVEGDMVEISIGSDDGILKGHTLEVFRLQPRPEYLGVIKIIDVKTDKAVGKIMTPQYKKKIQINDTVASSIVPAK